MERSRIVLLAADAMPNYQIARQLNIDAQAREGEKLVEAKSKSSPTLYPNQFFLVESDVALFWLVDRKQLRRGIFTPVKELEITIIEFIRWHNEMKMPFVWTKSADAILEKVERARKAIPNQ